MPYCVGFQRDVGSVGRKCRNYTDYTDYTERSCVFEKYFLFLLKIKSY